MKLIKEWKTSWRFSSVQVALFTSILSAVYAAMPDFQEMMNPTVYSIIVLVLNLAIIVARNIQQQLKQEELEEAADERSTD